MLSLTRKIRVLVVDDHTVMREGISGVVNSQPDMVVAGEAKDGRDAIEQFKTLKPDVALIDWNLPVVHGDQVISALLAEFPAARFIVITALNVDDNIRQAVRLGAKAFLFKNMLRRELLPAIRAVAQGHEYFPEQVLGRLEKGHAEGHD